MLCIDFFVGFAGTKLQRVLSLRTTDSHFRRRHGCCFSNVWMTWLLTATRWVPLTNKKCKFEAEIVWSFFRENGSWTTTKFSTCSRTPPSPPRRNCRPCLFAKRCSSMPGSWKRLFEVLLCIQHVWPSLCLLFITRGVVNKKIPYFGYAIWFSFPV